MKKKILLLALCLLIAATAISPWLTVAFIALGGIFVYLNKKTKESDWWKNKLQNMEYFMPQPYFRADHRRNFEMANLGSTPAAYDLSYDNVYGLNWSTGPQSLDMDFKILKFYHSYLKAGGFIALVLSPVKDKHKEDFRYYGKFYKQIPESDKSLYGDYYSPTVSLLDGKSYERLQLITLYRKIPLLFDFMNLLKYNLNAALNGGGNFLNSYSLRDKLTMEEENTLERIISFSQARGYKPFILIPPIKGNFQPSKLEEFAKYIQERFGTQVPTLDYSTDKEWTKEAHYNSTNHLSKTSANEFTEFVFNEIKAHYKYSQKGKSKKDAESQDIHKQRFSHHHIYGDGLMGGIIHQQTNSYLNISSSPPVRKERNSDKVR